MKGVVLCGGGGLRLNPITYSMPREMIPIANIPLIEYALKEMVRVGIRNIAMVMEEKSSIPNHLKDGKELKCRIKYFTQPKSIGTANALLCAKNFIDDDFVLVLGSTFFSFNLEEQIIQFKDAKYDALLLSPNNKNNEKEALDLRSISSGNESFKTNIDLTNSSDIGIFLFNQSILKAASRIKPSKSGTYDINDAVQYLISRDYRVGVSEIKGNYIKVIRARDILECNKYVLQHLPGRHVLGDGSELVNCRMGDNVSIGSRCIVKNSVISNSIIMDDCIINGIDIYDSIVGSHSTIAGSGTISGIFASDTTLYINN